MLYHFYDELICLVQKEWDERKFFFGGLENDISTCNIIVTLTIWLCFPLEIKEMGKSEYEILDRLVKDFLNVFRTRCSWKYYNYQLAESKSKSISFMIRKERGRLTVQKKDICYKILMILWSNWSSNLKIWWSNDLMIYQSNNLNLII